MRSKKFRRVSRTVLWTAIIVAACTPALEYNHSIEIKGALLVGQQRGGPLRDNSPITSELENPIITGSFSFTRDLENAGVTSEPGVTRRSCCERVVIRHPAASQNLMSTSFISILSNSSLNLSGMKMYLYAAPSVSLPADGSPIELVLSSESVSLHGTVRLHPDVIVLPVYVHVFVEPGRSVPTFFDRNGMASCFDGNRFAPPAEASPDLIRLSPRPSFVTSAGSHSTPGGPIETIITTQNVTSPYVEPDSIWKQAHIQFRLVNYFVTENAALARQIIDPVATRMATAAFHEAYVRDPSDQKGIHVYVGKNSMHFGTGLAVVAGITRQPSCDGGLLSVQNHIDLASDEAAGNTTCLVHELGHFLGLDHVDGSLSDTVCAGRLLDPGEEAFRNVMYSTATTNSVHLSAGQIAGARRIACAYVRLWELSSPACH